MSTHNGHAPGPWATSKDAVPAGFTQITVYEEQGGQRVATVFQTEANARLIAAAPELLEAARHAVMEWRLHESLTDSCRVLERAIAKAEGREGK